MKNEFEKLDQFMKDNRPDVSRIPIRALQLDRRPYWAGIAVACGISFLVTFGVIQEQRTEAESAVILSEVLSWDVTSDEFSPEVDMTLSMLE